MGGILVVLQDPAQAGLTEYEMLNNLINCPGKTRRYTTLGQTRWKLCWLAGVGKRLDYVCHSQCTQPVIAQFVIQHTLIIFPLVVRESTSSNSNVGWEQGNSSFLCMQALLAYYLPATSIRLLQCTLCRAFYLFRSWYRM